MRRRKIKKRLATAETRLSLLQCLAGAEVRVVNRIVGALIRSRMRVGPPEPAA